jgi:hypothetical protein
MIPSSMSLPMSASMQPQELSVTYSSSSSSESVYSGVFLRLAALLESPRGAALEDADGLCVAAGAFDELPGTGTLGCSNPKPSRTGILAIKAFCSIKARLFSSYSRMSPQR